MRLRLQLTKEGSLAYISHLDFVRMMERAVRVAEVPIEWSQGFNPRPHLAYSPALPVGVSSETEFVDMWLVRRRDPRAIAGEVGRALPAGARVLAAREIPLRAPALTAVVTAAEYRVSFAGRTALGQQDLLLAIANLGTEDCGDKKLMAELVILREDLVTIAVVVPAGSRRGPRPAEIAEQLGRCLGLAGNQAHVHRTGLLYGGADDPLRPLRV